MIERWETDSGLLFPWFREALKLVLAGGPHGWVVTDGYRTNEQQEAQYRQARTAASGRRVAPPGKSPHNYGCAVHVFPFSAGLDPYDIRSQAWRWLEKAIPPDHDLLWHGRTVWRWHHVEWRRWRDVALGVPPQ